MPAQYEKFFSPYLRVGRKQESWQYQQIEVCGQVLSAMVDMVDPYVSSTDANGYHLAIFPALEILSELALIHLHYAAGLTEKTREVWMRESKVKYSRAIRIPDNILFELRARSLRNRGTVVYGEVDFTVSDASGGLFEGMFKAIMP